MSHVSIIIIIMNFYYLLIHCQLFRMKLYFFFLFTSLYPNLIYFSLLFILFDFDYEFLIYPMKVCHLYYHLQHSFT